jgi:hypothetical protein
MMLTPGSSLAPKFSVIECSEQQRNYSVFPLPHTSVTYKRGLEISVIYGTGSISSMALSHSQNVLICRNLSRWPVVPTDIDNIDTGPLYAVAVHSWATKLGSCVGNGNIEIYVFLEKYLHDFRYKNMLRISIALAFDFT